MSKLNINKLFMMSLIGFLVFIVGIRGATRDTLMYINIFLNINDFNLLSPFEFYAISGVEIGYGWLSYIIRNSVDSYIFLFCIISFLTFFVLYKISIAVKIVFVEVLLLYLSTYFLMQQFMQIRQGLAIPIAIYSLIIFWESKISLKFWILSLIALSLHSTTIAVITCGVLIYPFIYIKQKLTVREFKVLSILLLIMIIFLSKYVILEMLMSLSNRVQAYSYSNFSESVSVFRLPNIKAILTFILFTVLINDRLYKNKIFIFLYLLFIIGIGFRIGFIDFGILSGRLAIAFQFVEIFLYPIILTRFDIRSKCLILFILLAIQAIATYGYQAPYVISDYFIPINI